MQHFLAPRGPCVSAILGFRVEKACKNVFLIRETPNFEGLGKGLTKLWGRPEVLSEITDSESELLAECASMARPLKAARCA